jgi:hypothetical protein
VNDKSIRVIFWVMVAFFIFIMGTMFVGVRLAGNWPVINFFLPSVFVFTILGITLLVLTVKKKVKGIRKVFLLLTGASAVGWPVFVVLHNLVTALIISFFHVSAEFDEPLFFIIAIVVCPLGFLVGAISNIVLTIKNKPGQLAV